MLKYGEFDQLAGHAVRPSDYVSPTDFYRDYQSVKLLGKFERLPVDADPTRAAMEKFIEAEVSCAEVNETWKNGFRGLETTPDVAAVLFRAQRKIATILGPVPDLQHLDFRFGPGAAFGVRKRTSAYNKLASVPEATFTMLPILGALRREFPSWLGLGPIRIKKQLGSELTFVPKNALTHRSICIEPLLNGLYQKGFGSYMRERLNRFGVNLNDQSINQKMAQRALDHQLCTVDFSSASDSIAYMLVLNLLPIDWFEALDVARCPNYSVDGSWYAFHKFTSMGNAYTFELETLIFYALAVSACEIMGIEYKTQENLHVYGDDVIIPRAAFHLFQEVCSLCGFSINAEKSFLQGPFFESCGQDYFLGTQVRPFMLKRDISSLEGMYYATNCILRAISTLENASTATVVGARIGNVVRSLHDVHRWCVSCIPRKYRFLGPAGHGDGHLVADFDVALPAQKRELGGHVYRTISRKPNRVQFSGRELIPLAYPLYHSGLDPFDLKEYLRSIGNREEYPFDFPRPPDNGKGYDVRGGTQYRVIKTTLYGDWPLAPTIWSDEAIALVVMVDFVRKSRKRRPRLNKRSVTKARS
jgi:hypothetical protein